MGTKTSTGLWIDAQSPVSPGRSTPLLAALILSALFVVTIRAADQVHSIADETPVRLSPHRVRAGQLLALVTAVALALGHSDAGLIALLPLWAAMAATGASRRLLKTTCPTGGFQQVVVVFTTFSPRQAANGRGNAPNAQAGLQIASQEMPCSKTTLSRMRAPPDGVTIMIQLSLQPVLALVAGILILVQPKFLNYIVALYLIVIGVLGLAGGL